ncbi:hypothetical protein MUK42_33891 [Musa troglodytarum]|uniref:Uncharacterized protein n=1 Tax=Musa troglodytarum TaxID=320322 RepID=A0A9E7HV77_9LILI|nr:hypothetical protein MUK42_33891 [Musa troglodytarum]
MKGTMPETNPTTFTIIDFWWVLRSPYHPIWSSEEKRWGGDRGEEELHQVDSDQECDVGIEEDDRQGGTKMPRSNLLFLGANLCQLHTHFRK